MLVWWSDQTSNWMPWLPRAQHPENKSCKSFKTRVKAFWQCGEYGCDMCHLRNWPSQPLSIPTAAGLCGCNSLHRPRVSICSICIIPKSKNLWSKSSKLLGWDWKGHLWNFRNVDPHTWKAGKVERCGENLQETTSSTRPDLGEQIESQFGWNLLPLKPFTHI